MTDVAKWRATSGAAWLLCLEACALTHAPQPGDRPAEAEPTVDAAAGEVEPPADEPPPEEAPERFDITYEQLPEDCTLSLEDIEFEGGTFTIAFWMAREVNTDFQYISYTSSAATLHVITSSYTYGPDYLAPHGLLARISPTAPDGLELTHHEVRAGDTLAVAADVFLPSGARSTVHGTITLQATSEPDPGAPVLTEVEARGAFSEDELVTVRARFDPRYAPGNEVWLGGWGFAFPMLAYVSDDGVDPDDVAGDGWFVGLANIPGWWSGSGGSLSNGGAPPSGSHSVIARARNELGEGPSFRTTVVLE